MGVASHSYLKSGFLALSQLQLRSGLECKDFCSSQSLLLLWKQRRFCTHHDPNSYVGNALAKHNSKKCIQQHTRTPQTRPQIERSDRVQNMLDSRHNQDSRIHALSLQG